MNYNEQWDFDFMEDAYNSMNKNLDELTQSVLNDNDVVGVKIPKKDENYILKYPITSDEINMKDKKCDYNLLALLTLLSKHNRGENHRYIYKDDILLNKEKIENLSKRKINTIIKNVRKLSKLEGNAVVAKEINGKIAYIINYKNNEGRKYVLIEEDILINLLDVSNSNLIKIYVLLKYRCNEMTETRITRKDIADNIGLSLKSKESLTTITNIIKDLSKKGLIKVTRKYENKLDENGNFNYARYLYIKLCSYEDWKIKDEQAIENKE